ncbi:hypothetical protein [Tuberibacillus calidus]|jgi:hypothetical protein|uniref:hypothetical protein n=1 Tax=Tuberibacillus calidus TaxID=340097 RepID=UPI0003FF09BC|nr:hypothetical protein [Tuberibacillus calidus]
MFFKPTNVEIAEIKINNADHSGRVSLGSTIQIGRHVCAKKSQGFGQQMSDLTLRAFNWHAVRDDDVLEQQTIKIRK